jgi:pyrroline-5-carboxylate reductase
VKIAAIERLLGRIAVVRVMPNLAAKVGCAMSAVAAGRWATAGHRAAARQIFESVGRVVELPERLFDAVTAISGSGPAYFFLIFRSLRDAGVRQGLPKPLAQQLAVQTAAGAACIVDGLGEDLDRLMTQVASKGGTTEAALKVLGKRRVVAHFTEALRAAARRSRQLSWS